VVAEETGRKKKGSLLSAAEEKQAILARQAAKKKKTSGGADGSGPSIFDKLTDSSNYTGAHKERFDKSGKGRGRQGRRSSEDRIEDISQITRDAPGPVGQAQLTAAGAGGRKLGPGKKTGRGGSARMSPSPRRSAKRGAAAGDRSPAGRPGKPALSVRRISDGYAAESVRSSPLRRSAAAAAGGGSSGDETALRERVRVAEDSAAAAARREETIHAELGGLQQEMSELMARLQRSEQALEVERAEKLALQEELQRLLLLREPSSREGRRDGEAVDADDHNHPPAPEFELVLASGSGRGRQTAATAKVDDDDDHEEQLVLAVGGRARAEMQAEETDDEFLAAEREAEGIAATEQAALQAEAEAIAIAYAAAAAAGADRVAPPSSNASSADGDPTSGLPAPSLGELSLERWLSELCVEQYAEGLRDNGVISVASMAEMSAADLTELLTAVAVKKGHQKKISKALALALAAHDEQQAAPSMSGEHSADLLPERAPRDIRRLNWQLEGAQRELDELREMKESYEINAADADTQLDAAAARSTRSPGVVPAKVTPAKVTPVARGLAAAAAMHRGRGEEEEDED